MIPIQIDCDFPGGNILVDSIEGDYLRVHQDLRDTDIDWFYYYFRIRGAAGRRLTIELTGSEAMGARGPALSLDGGSTWRWLGVITNPFPLDVRAGTQDLRLCFGIPYLQDHLDRFLQPLLGQPALRKEELCRSRKGRPVELLQAGCLERDPAFQVLLTARHHCCEMMASYSLEGILAKVFESSPAGDWLRRHVSFWIVPFMDKDGVEDGDQGKNRRPWDHNRDYTGESIYPEVAAVRRLVTERCKNRLALAFDLHCPWIKGFLNEFPYFVGGQDPHIWRETNRFSDLLAACRRGPIPFYRENNLPFGMDWNIGSEPGRRSFAEWASALPGIRIASTIEFPYANALGAEVNPHSARAFGADLGEGIFTYLMEQCNPKSC